MEVNKNFKRTEVGILPKDWEVDSIGNNSTSSSGSTPLRALHDRYFKDGTIHWTKTLDLNNSLIRDTQEKVTQTAINETSLRIYPVESVLVAMYGGFGQIGRTGLLKVPSCVNQALTAITPNPKKLNSYYLLRILNFRVNYWRSVASSSRKDPNISGRDVREFLLPLPDIKEQEAIANALSDADAYIESLEKLIAKKRLIKKGVMQELLTGRRRLEGFKERNLIKTEIGVLPADWKVVPLKSLSTLMTNGFVGSATKHYVDNSKGVLYIQGYNVEENSFNFNGIKYVTYDFHRSHMKSCLQEGDMLMIQTGDVGLTTIVTKSLVGSNCHALIITRFKQKEADSSYFSYYLNSPLGRSRLGLLETGTTMKHINVGDLLEFLVPVPSSIEEQNAISFVLRDVQVEIELVEKKLQKARLIKQGMMQELLTGRIRLV